MEQVRLATLLDIGRSLAAATDTNELRRSLMSRMSNLFESDLLFCADAGAAGTARVILLVEEGSARQAAGTYAAFTSAATPETGRVLSADEARACGIAPDRGASLTGALVVPVRQGDRVFGELGALRSIDAPFAAEEADLLAFAAAILATALGQRQRMEETETRRREAERLEEIGRAITSSLELKEVLERVMQAVLDLTNADVCSVWRREGDRSRVVASRGRGAPPVGLDVDVAPPIVSALLTFRQSIQIGDLSSDARLPPDMRATLAGDGPRAAILVPMVCDDAVVGVLAVGHREPQSCDDDAMGILERLALQAAIALENARLHTEIRDLSLRDPLTGLPNRRHMEMVLATEIEAARRGRPLVVVLLDLDDFKGYNDEHGHTAGDNALREFAELLASETRAMNLAVRYGGDEFLIIMSESSIEGAEYLVERIGARIRDNPRLHGIGVSAGIAQHSPEMDTPSALIEAADAALYRRKVEPRAGH
ncbi:MAG TPA: sensor domain-containing diguanylate cyclase [Longimicrobiales bacterium]|nr:sensor domain-containing diguanylate cyclase [Longimicrobiales bacterium]